MEWGFGSLLYPKTSGVIISSRQSKRPKPDSVNVTTKMSAVSPYMIHT